MARFPLQGIYPRIGHIINRDLPNIVNDSLKFRVFKQFGGFSDYEARQALRANSLPIISIRDHTTKWGHYPPPYPKYKNEVFISKTIVDQYERLHRQWSNSPEFSAVSAFSLPHHTDIRKQNDRWRFTISKARLHVEATILHEIVHWGDMNALGTSGNGADGQTKDKFAWKRGWADLGHLFVSRAYKGQIEDGKDKYGWKVNKVNIDGWLGWDKNDWPF